MTCVFFSSVSGLGLLFVLYHVLLHSPVTNQTKSFFFYKPAIHIRPGKRFGPDMQLNVFPVSKEIDEGLTLEMSAF